MWDALLPSAVGLPNWSRYLSCLPVESGLYMWSFAACPEAPSSPSSNRIASPVSGSTKVLCLCLPPPRIHLRGQILKYTFIHTPYRLIACQLFIHTRDRSRYRTIASYIEQFCHLPQCAASRGTGSLSASVPTNDSDFPLDNTRGTPVRSDHALAPYRPEIDHSMHFHEIRSGVHYLGSSRDSTRLRILLAAVLSSVQFTIFIVYIKTWPL